MSESWSTSRQALTIGESAFNFDTDRAAIVVSGERTYIEINGLTIGYIPISNGIWSLCTGHQPDYSDIKICLTSILHSDSSRNCICSIDTNVVRCITQGVDDSGPVVLEYPKYYRDSTIPPNFDVNFRIYSEAQLDWSSFVVTISASNGNIKSYSFNDSTIINITPQISEIRIIPSNLITLVGDTVNIKVFLKDVYNRELSLNW